jgi:outer membrane protein TolC
MPTPVRNTMRGARIYLFSFIILSAWFTIQVMAGETLTWEGCVEEALKNNPDLVSAQEKVRQAKADKGITQSAMLPEVSSQLSAKTSESSNGQTQDTYSYALRGQQLVFDGFKTVADIGAASKTITAQEYNYFVTSSNVRLNLRVAFITLLRAQELISLTEEIAERRAQNLELVQLRYEAGREHKGALLTAQADLAEAKFEVTQAERNLSLAQRELTKELGREKKLLLQVQGSFDIPEGNLTKPDFESLADTTPLLKELIAKKEAARLGYSAAQGDFFPEVYVNGSVGKTASHWPPQSDEWSAGVTVSFPLFEGGSRIARASKAKSQFRQAQADERSGRDSVILTLEETWKKFQDAIDIVSVKNKFLEAAEERAKIASAQYSQGLITFDDWIIIENNLVNAKKAYLDAQADLLVAEADWIQAKGGTLEYVQK